MSSNIANGRKSNYLILDKITLFILILASNFEKQGASHQSKFFLFGYLTKNNSKAIGNAWFIN